MRGIEGGALLLVVLTAFGQSSTVPDGVRAFHEGRYADAAKILEQHATDPAAVAFRAMALAATGRCTDAEPKLRESLSGSDSTIRRLSGLALVQCQISAKQYGAAVPLLETLQREFPKDADVMYETARLHMRAWNEAVFAMFQNAPASFRVNQLSAEVFETQSRYGDAITEYRKAIAKNSAALNLHFRLGRALLLDSHEPAALEAARKEFEAELALNPNDAAAEYQIGQILIAQQLAAEAAPHFEKALNAAPDFAEALVGLAKIRVADKQYETAIPLLERAVRIQPQSESARYSLMMAYRNTGRAADALRQKEELERLQKPPEGEFTRFLEKLGEKPAAKP